jgi:hypothetical protein
MRQISRFQLISWPHGRIWMLTVYKLFFVCLLMDVLGRVANSWQTFPASSRKNLAAVNLIWPSFDFLFVKVLSI